MLNKNDETANPEGDGTLSNIYTDVACCAGSYSACPRNRVCKNSIKGEFLIVQLSIGFGLYHVE